MRLHGSVEIAVANTPTKVLAVPSDYIAEIKSIIIANNSANPALVTVTSGDGTATDDYRIVAVVVQPGQTLVLDEKAIGGVRSVKDVYAAADNTPVQVTVVAEVW